LGSVFPVQVGDGLMDRRIELVGGGKGLMRQIVCLEIVPAVLDGIHLGVCLGRHSIVSHGRAASASVVALLVRIGPLSKDHVGGRFR
jgi:hypothetical protein